MRRQPLPTVLGPSFSVREARDAGVNPDRLRANDLAAPFHGIRCARATELETVLDRCRTYEPRLTPAQFFSHRTAAALWALPLPYTTTEALHVSAITPAREPRTRGVIGHRVTMSFDQLALCHGLPVANPAETWAQSGTFLTLDDLIAMGDAILTRGLATPDELAQAAGRLRRRGGKDLAEALPSLRAGAESPRESLVRLILVRAGLPEPEINWVLTDPTGVFVARLDLAYPAYRVAVEYDGRQHAEQEQFRRDADRWPAIAAQGWQLIRVVDHHLSLPQQRIIAPTIRALRARGWPGPPASA